MSTGYLILEVRRAMRSTRFLIFTIAMPVALFLLVDAVRRVHRGLRVVDPSLAAESLATGQNPLTERERDVLRVSIEGGTIADVARVLHLSQGTVRNHLSSAIGKTGARTRAEAAKLAEVRGWL